MRVLLVVCSIGIGLLGFLKTSFRGDAWPVVLTGHPAPGTAEGRFTGFGQAAVNASGTIVFQTLLDVGGIQSHGIYQVSEGKLSPVALEGQRFPDSTTQWFGGYFGDPQINNSGDIAFSAVFADGLFVPRGIFLSSGGTLRKVFDTNTAAPVNTGERFLNEIGTVRINDSGDIAFAGSLARPEGGRVRSGIFMISRGSLRAIFVDDISASVPFSLNNRGDIAFRAPSGELSLYSNGSVQTLVADGRTVPNSTIIIRSPGFPWINDDRDVVFVNYISGCCTGRGGITDIPNAVIRWRSGQLEKIAAAGDPVSGIPGAVFDSSFAEPRINLSGISFTGRTAARSGQPAIRVIGRFQDGRLTVVASEDELLEGIGKLDSIGQPNFDAQRGIFTTFAGSATTANGIFSAQAGRYTLLFPQMADGSGPGGRWRTTFILANRATAPANVTINFYDDAGAVVRAPRIITVPAVGVAQFQTDGASALQTGWATAQSDQNLSGIALFQFSDSSGKFIGEVGAPASVPLRSMSVFVQSGSATATGVALANPNRSSADVTLTLKDGNSREIARSSITIAGMGHLSKYAAELFPAMPAGEFEGKIEIVSTQPLVCLTLRQHERAFTSLPVIP